MLPTSAHAFMDVQPEPNVTKNASNYWYASWSVPGTNNSAYGYITWILHNGSATGPVAGTWNTPCLVNCGGTQNSASGTRSIQITGLANGQQYSMCATLKRQDTLGFWWQDEDCFDGDTWIDTGAPEIVLFGFGGAAEYITNANQALAVDIRYEDQVSQPWPSNWLKVVLKNSAGTAYHTSAWLYSSTCSAAPVYQGVFSGWYRYDFSCTWNPQSYATSLGITLQDGPVELGAQSADSAVPDAQSWGSTTANMANLSAPLGAALVLDRVQPTIVPAANDTTPATGQSVAFNSSGSSDLTSGIDSSQWSWNWGDGTAGATAASASHTFSVAGTYTVNLTGKDRAGWSKTTPISITVSPAPGAPVNTALPAISGTPSVGQTLACSNGTWTGTPAPTFARAWLRAGAAIPSATNPTYVTTSADVGKLVACRVVGTNTAGSTQATSAAVTVVALLPPRTTAAAGVIGTGVNGALLTCNKGTWTGTPTITYVYQWLRNGVAITGQTAATHRVVMADTGRNLQCRVKGANTAGSATTTSANKWITSVKPLNTALPRITGTLRVGKSLFCANGTWTGTTPITFTRQWYRGTTAITGATGTSYTLKSADRGRRMKCKVVARNAAGSTPKFSALTNTVQ